MTLVLQKIIAQLGLILYNNIRGNVIQSTSNQMKIIQQKTNKKRVEDTGGDYNNKNEIKDKVLIILNIDKNQIQHKTEQ